MRSSGGSGSRTSALRCAALIVAFVAPLATLTTPATSSQENDLLALINGYRSAPQDCGGKQMPVVGPLSPDPALARVKPGPDGSLQHALKDAGYLASRAQLISLSGPSDASGAMQWLAQRYCLLLSSPRYSAIGISREDNTWRIVFAQPLLPDNLGDWREAGKEILRLVNIARAQSRTCGKQHYDAANPLAWNARLAQAAHMHSRDMAAGNYFSHEGLDGSDASDRARRAAYAWRRIGENIAAGQGSQKK